MDHQDRQAIEGLFAKLAEVERQSGPRDAEAEAFIRQRIDCTAGSALPHGSDHRRAGAGAQRCPGQHRGTGAPACQPSGRRRRIPVRPLRWRAAATRPSAAPISCPSRVYRPIWLQAVGQMAPGRGGGGFLAGAAQTAMGVAGGVLLGNMIAGAFSGGDEAKAGEASQPEPQQAAAEDFGDSGDDPGFDDV